ncbi:hypothetical protein [uncultured Secundilactobacillus sp.]|uniref:hypothetical protein n=1 Tax=uncultured Secundilactobacillus sp. TaxID=2813935 RepID=UPI00258B4120|nr:hypothetical protein [uncultured Secundilactobacillus sp.]
MKPFNDSFYQSFKSMGLEKTYTVTRGPEVISDSLKGILSKNTLIISPKSEMPLKIEDVVSDQYNRYVVLKINDSGGQGTVWQISVESFEDHERKAEASKPSITNQISNSGLLSQIIGDHNNLSVEQNCTASLGELSSQLSQIHEEDRQLFLELISQIETIQKEPSSVKRGILKRFDGLLGKYPNLALLVPKVLLGWLISTDN